MKPPPSDPLRPEDSPGVPGFQSWRGVYLFVFAFFVVCVILLALLSHAFA